MTSAYKKLIQTKKQQIVSLGGIPTITKADFWGQLIELEEQLVPLIGGVKTINGESPVAGNVALSAADVGAIAASSASDLGLNLIGAANQAAARSVLGVPAGGTYYVDAGFDPQPIGDVTGAVFFTAQQGIYLVRIRNNGAGIGEGGDSMTFVLTAGAQEGVENFFNILSPTGCAVSVAGSVLTITPSRGTPVYELATNYGTGSASTLAILSGDPGYAYVGIFFP